MLGFNTNMPTSWSPRVKPTTSWTPRVKAGGLGDPYYNNPNFTYSDIRLIYDATTYPVWNPRTKPTTNWTPRVKP